MNPGRFYIPNYMGMRNIPNYMGMRNIPIYNSMLGLNTHSVPKGIGLFNKITNSIRSVNWSGLLTNANKTLNVVNQAIPLVRQAGPMVSNVKNMLMVAKAFGNETTSNNKNITYRNNNISNNTSSNYDIGNNKNEFLVKKKEVQNDNAPNL